MTKAKIDPGICGLITTVEVTVDEDMQATVTVHSGCEAVKNMIVTVGNTFDAYELCLTRPANNALYDYAKENFPFHGGCPTIAGIIKAVEVEAKLALPKNVSISFE